MDGTIIGQGTFLATASVNPNPGSASNSAGNFVVVAIPSGADWMKVYNYTKAGQNGISSIYFNGTANSLAGIEFYWQRGMAPGTGMVKWKTNAASTLSEDTFAPPTTVGGGGGFTLYDPTGQTPGSLQPLGASVATTATTNATQPVVSTANTAGVTVGSVIRMNSSGQGGVDGIDMVVSAVVANTSITLLATNNALANVPGVVGGAGFYRLVNYNPIFYPWTRYVTNVTQAVNAQVSTSVPHGLTPGQEVRFNIPPQSGMVQLNSSANSRFIAAIVLTIVDDYDFTINVNTTGYAPFTWPTAAQQPSSFPIVTPIGEDTATSLITVANQTPSIGGMQIFNTNTGILADSTVNTSFLGMILGSAGRGVTLTTPISGPAGTVHYTAGNVIDVADQMYWVAGKSTYGGQ